MGLVERIKTQYEMWKIEKYTKRRPIVSSNFEQRDAEFYRENYKDGVYLHHHGMEQTVPQKNSNLVKNIHRKSTILRTKSEKIMRSSENYNTSQH